MRLHHRQYATGPAFQISAIKGCLGETILFEVGLEEEQLSQMHQAATQVNDAKGVFAQATFVLSPFHIQEPGNITITVLADGEDLDCAGLQISVAPEGLQIV